MYTAPTTNWFSGFDRRYWRDRGDNGLFFTDLPIQSSWDGSRLQPGRQANLTGYQAGNAASRMARGSAQHQRDLAIFGQSGVSGCEQVPERKRWPDSRGLNTNGARAAIRASPRGSTAFSGAAVPTGRMFFAGEHTSFDYQYMEGGAVAGKEAAKGSGRQFDGVPETGMRRWPVVPCLETH